MKTSHNEQEIFVRCEIYLGLSVSNASGAEVQSEPAVSCSAIAAGGVLRHLGQLYNIHRPLIRNTAEWLLFTSVNAYY